ncbi:hypothetical protein [Yoonia sp. SS1-5]|uniref:Uncharacterized protein n=1 Tax=Yoonia rhodophyticola TaxID=3137370 RepID=A0AAN0M9T9_9RHOB
MAKASKTTRKGSATKKEKIDLEPDAPLKAMQADENSDLVAISGYLGDDPDDPDAVRLYSSLNFDSYTKVSRDAVVQREKLDSRDGGPAGSILWVSSDAEVTRRQVNTQKMRADFLRGTINPDGPRAVGDLSAGPGAAFTSLPCVTATIVVTTTILTSRSDSTNSNCCSSDGCSATSQCLCSGGGQSGPSCNVC